ncbi:MAG: 6-bladed beta-propeller [Acidobacteriota bacterium]|nr:6-bladed beta-propeller [Acidobacteriota bacterium]
MLRFPKFVPQAVAAILCLGSVGSVAVGASSPQDKPAPAVRMVANAIKPRDGVVTSKLTELWSIGGEDDARGELVNRPFEIRLAADGTAYVSDWGDVCIRVFDARGKLLRQVGRKGQGPGEYDVPFYFDVDGQGRIYVLDMRSMRVTRFDPAGKFEAGFRLEKIASQIRVDGRGRIFAGEMSVGEPNYSAEFKIVERLLTIVRYDPDGRNAIRIGPFKSEKMSMKGMPGGGIVSGSSPFSPQAGWGIDPDGRLWLGHSETYEIGVLDPDGKPLFRFGRAWKPVRNKSFDEIAVANRKNSVVTEYFPAYAPDFSFDEAGNVWLRMFRNDDKGEPQRYDVFSPQGVYLKQVVLPCRIYQVRHGKMIGVVETEDGYKTLKCYRY